MDVDGDRATPPHLAALDLQALQPGEPDSVAVVETHLGAGLHSAVLRDALMLRCDPWHVESGGVPPDRERPARTQDSLDFP